MHRDTTRARLQVLRAVKAHKAAVDALERLTQILADMDARTGKRDPTKRAKRLKSAPRKRARRKGGP